MQILPNSGHQIAPNRLKSHWIRVDHAVYERQLFPKAAVQPSTWQANANVALGSAYGRSERQKMSTVRIAYAHE